MTLSLKAIHQVLCESVPLDPYLEAVAARVASHSFLRGATQGCYIRMVNLLTAHVIASGRQPGDVRVLDWGTGKGHITYLLRKAGFAVVSCDILSDADDSTFGQETPIIADQAIEVVPLTDPWKLPFADASFDMVLSFGVLEHVPNDLESLKELRRVLKFDGVLFFSFLPHWLSWSQRIARLRGNWYHPRLYGVRGVRAMAHDSGFDVEAIWRGQFLPKNSAPHSNVIERLDRLITYATPLRHFATNIEGLLRAR